jgi:hypothetical protein
MATIALAVRLLFMAALVSGAVGVADIPRLDAALLDARDAAVHLSSFRGKPLVLFYEDRFSAEQNTKLKQALRERAEARQHGRGARVVGVANVAAYDFWPARGFVLSAVRAVERRDRVPVLLDWKRVLGEAPWSLPDGASSVVLLDAEGHLVRAWSGVVEGEALEQFFEELAKLLKATPASASL